MDQLWQRVVELDLKSVRRKFAARKSWWWHLFRSADQIEGEYRQFLFLLAGNPDKLVVPWSDDVDAFWRQHADNTIKYVADCDAIVGRPIQYTPQSVKRSSRYLREREETTSLYLASFGEAARRRRRAAGESWLGADTVQVFSDNTAEATVGRHAHHGWLHARADSHHPTGHHHDPGMQAPAHHGGGHGCGHGGHGCGGHSGCGGHGH